MNPESTCVAPPSRRLDESVDRHAGETPALRTWVHAVALVILALAIRLVFLFNMPAFIESNELRITFDLLSGKHFPLNDFRPYLGALNIYLIALSFKVAGLHSWVPRCVPLLGGTLSVYLTYLLARRLFDHRVAIIAGLMMAVCAYPVFFLSHVPWPNSTTPFFAIASLLCFVIWLQDQRAIALIGAAFLMGLAVQTHPLAASLAPGMLIVFLLQGKTRVVSMLRNPATYTALAAAALGYANMIYFLLTREDAGLNVGKAGKYALEHKHNIFTYWTNFKSAWLLLFRLLAGAVQDLPSFTSYLLEPAFVLCALGFFCGLIFCFQKRKPQIPILIISSILFISYINEAYEFYNFGRYLGFLVPLACIATAVAMIHFADAFNPRFPKVLGPALLVLLVGSYMAHQVSQLAYSYGRFAITGNSSEMYEIVRTTVNEFGHRNVVVLLDDSMSKLTPIHEYLESDGYEIEGISGYDSRDHAVARDYWKRRVQMIEASGKIPVEVMSPYGISATFGTHHFDKFNECVVDLRKPDAEILACARGGPAIFGAKQRRSHRRHLNEPESDDSEEE